MNEIFKVWTVFASTETNPHFARVRTYSNEALARQGVAGHGPWGSDGVVQQEAAVQVDGRVYVLVSAVPVDLDGLQAKADEDLKQRTLAALTPDQRRVLGV